MTRTIIQKNADKTCYSEWTFKLEVYIATGNGILRVGPQHFALQSAMKDNS